MFTKRNVKVVAGTGSNNTRKPFATRNWRKEMVLMVVLVTTYYNKPTAAGLIGALRTICEAAPDFPVILYTTFRTHQFNVSAETQLAIAGGVPGYCGCKRSLPAISGPDDGNYCRARRLLRCSPAMIRLTLPLVAAAAEGVISVFKLCPAVLAIWLRSAPGDSWKKFARHTPFLS